LKKKKKKKKSRRRRSKEDCFYRARPRGGWQGSEGGGREAG